MQLSVKSKLWLMNKSNSYHNFPMEPCTIMEHFTVAKTCHMKVYTSVGNHAQAAALTARWSGIPAHIVMPSNSSKVKVAAVKGVM